MKGETDMGLQIVVDRDKCEGLGMCEAMASDYFEVREDADGEEEGEDASTGEKTHLLTPVCPLSA